MTAKKDKKTLSKQDKESREDFQRRFKSHPGIFIGTIVVLVIVIVAFVFVPAIVPSAGIGSGIDLTFGKYDKTPITFTPGSYFAQIRDNITQNQQNSGQDISNPYINYQIWRAAFDQTVVHTAVLQEMDKTGYAVPDETVDKAVASLPQFQDNGVFSAIRYRQMDNASRSALWRQIKEELITSRYFDDISSLLMSSKEAPFIKSMTSPERTFDMAAFSIDSYPDSEVIAFARENAALFQTTHLSKITVKSSEREIKQILESIQSGATTFEEAAKAHSVDAATAEKSGDMGVKMAYELMAEIPDTAAREAVIALEAGSFSDIIKTDAGWTFFRADEVSRPSDTSDETAFQKIKSYIMNTERGRVEDWFVNEAESLASAARTSSFADAAAAKGLEVKRFGPVPINYGGSQLLPPFDTSAVPELSSGVFNENFWKTAFSTPLNTPSAPIVIGDYTAMLFPVEEKPADTTIADNTENAYSSFFLSYMMEQQVRGHFLRNGKLQDNFMNVYFRYFTTEG